MTSSNLFLKTFDPIIMNGFKNKKELENYWLFSQIGCVSLSLGILSFLLEILFFENYRFNFYSLTIIVFSSFFLFGFIFSLPFIINWIFIKLVPENLTYMYVKYMWYNSKSAIIVVISELPQTILTEKELAQLVLSKNEKESVKILIKVWHKTFTKAINNKLAQG